MAKKKQPENKKVKNLFSCKEKRNKFVQYSQIQRITRYEAKKHIGLLYDVFSKGEDVMAFCAEALISRHTFYYWLKHHPEFKFAYDIAINIAGRLWEQLPFSGRSFNYPHWSFIMRTRFGLGRIKVEKTEGAKNPSDRIEAIWKGLESGELSINEVSQLTSIIANQVNIMNNDPNKDEKALAINTKEELNNKIEILTAVLDYVNKSNKTNEGKL